MANDKLKELTGKLYEEGLSKGQKEGERILAEARTRAEEILAKAQSEADKMIAEARRKAEETALKAASDIRTASIQSMEITKTDIQNVIMAKSMDGKIERSLNDTDFVKALIMETAKRFNSESACDLSVVLPEKMKADTEDFVKNAVAEAIGGGLDVSFSKKIKGGFTIGPKNGEYFISMTDESFKALIREYLRPVTRKLLFGE